MCSNLSLSLIFSLINQNFISISTFSCTRYQTPLLNKVNTAIENLFQHSHHVRNCHQRDSRIFIISDKNIHITIRGLLPS